MVSITNKLSTCRYLTDTHHFIDSLKALRAYISKRIGYIQKEASAMLAKGKSDAEVQMYLDKNQASIKILEEHLQMEEVMVESLLEIIQDFELELKKAQNRARQNQYEQNLSSIPTMTERLAIRATQYAKWSDYF